MPGNFFILNPAAGHGRAGRFWLDLRDEALSIARGSRYAVTERPGHAGELAREAVLGGFDRVIAVGGDGTVCEALEGLMSLSAILRRRTVLGVLPAGSGCDLARHLGCPRDRAGLLDMLARGVSRPIDVGRVSFISEDGKPGARHFINIAAFGLAGEVARQIHRMGKPFGGTISYAVSSLLAILGARTRELRLKADGREIGGRFHLGVVANTSSMGGGMLVAPGAKDDDGVMDLVLAGDMSRLRLALAMPKIYDGSHLSLPGITTLPVKRLEAGSDEPVWLNIDGEAAGRLPAVFETLPLALRVLVPFFAGAQGAR